MAEASSDGQGASADSAAGDGESAAGPTADAAAGGGDEADAGPGRATISEEEVSALLEKGGKDSVRPYDLSARRVNLTQLPMLETLCRNFAGRAAVSLSALLGRDAGMQFEHLQTSKVEELQPALPVPATIAVIRLKPLPGTGCISVEPALLLTLLDGFFGGAGRAPADVQPATAPAAQRFLGLLLRSFTADMVGAWTPVAPLEFELVKQEINPRLLELGSPQDSIVVAKFLVEFGASSGHIDWLLPAALLAPVREMLASDTGKPIVRKQVDWSPALGSLLQGTPLEARAVLAQKRISLGEVVRLAPGDIIPIDPPQQVTLLAGEVPLFRGRFGVSKGHNAMKIIPEGAQ